MSESFSSADQQHAAMVRLEIRALEAHGAGASYRVIAELLSGKKRIPIAPGRRMICAIERSASCKAASR
ncbi:hypothetical protein [Bradyrhizobium sp. CCBAU 45389]|uniref:hypothetical protein n=1 Tax=Bradyrhizobium sp. CCBAU 45389 TaxID=858429 RepID=UPI00230680C6|nr:hypothetical protein [Bradyrhizobium sp. CCBAU 45389]